MVTLAVIAAASGVSKRKAIRAPTFLKEIVPSVEYATDVFAPDANP